MIDVQPFEPFWKSLKIEYPLNVLGPISFTKSNDPPDINLAFFEDWMLEIDNSQPGLKKAKPEKDEPKKCICEKMDVIWFGCKCGGC